MRLLVLTGFFGSGKTTFLLRALRLATREAHLRTVLVQNEIGRVSVDTEVFRSDDLIVDELLGGCICCDLSARFVSLLHKLVSENSTDLVLVEASGIATLGMVRQILSGTDLESLPLLQVNLLDAARLKWIEKVLALPIVHEGIEEADLCIVNKIDVATSDFREDFEARARKIRPDAPIHFTNLSANETLPNALSEPLMKFFKGAQPAPVATDVESDHDHEHHHEHDHHGHPTVCALETTETALSLLSSEKIRMAFDDFIHGIRDAGGLIGHVKVAFIGTDGSRYFLNSAGIAQPKETPLPDNIALARAVVNAIVWRIDQSTLELLTRKFLFK